MGGAIGHGPSWNCGCRKHFSCAFSAGWSWVLGLLVLLALVETSAGHEAHGSKDSAGCEKVFWAVEDGLARWQLCSDFFIAVAYFSIPIELVYFVHKSQVFPYRWILVQFGSFITLCGLTHAIAMWTYGPHSHSVMVTQTLAKLLTALVSCATAITLVYIIPELLSLKVREVFLKSKAAELDREMGLIRTQEEASRSVRMLTHEIRSTLDRHTILKTTMVELAHTLQLENCTIWMPSRGGAMLELTHELSRRLLDCPVIVPCSDPTVQSVLNTSHAITLNSRSPIGISSSVKGGHEDAWGESGRIAAVRLPLLRIANFNHEEIGEATFALMVLVLPSRSARQWRPHELEMVEVVADQVAVALSHAAVLEESQRAREKLLEQNVALSVARQEAETAIRARNDFLAVMNHEMRTPMHAIIALSSLLYETDLSEEQRSMLDTITKSGTLLSTLINDVLDFSRLEDGSLALDERLFDLHTIVHEAENLAQPMARAKGLNMKLAIDATVPQFVIGDDKRLLQTCLNIVGNAVKFTKEGSVDMHLQLEHPDLGWDPQAAGPRPVLEAGPRAVYTRITVKDTGLGVKKSDIPKLFKKFVQADSTTTRNFGGTGLGLAICKKFVELMEGRIWLESEGLGKGSTVTMVVKLGVPMESPPASPVGEKFQPHPRPDLQGLRVLVCDDNSVNRIVTRKLLDRLGCKTLVVEDGLRCLEELAKPGHGFQVLLLDVCMPGIDGYEVAQRIIAQNGRNERPLILALTANTDRRTRERCLAIGMDGVVLKPISLGEIREVLCGLLERVSGHEQNQRPSRASMGRT